MDDLISRRAAINIAMQYCPDDDGSCSKAGADIREMLDELEDLPSAQLTLYGYPIEHLVMIARVMAKEHCTPEDVARLLQNAGEVAKMVRDEMMEMLKECVERTCKGVADEEGTYYRTDF